VKPKRVPVEKLFIPWERGLILETFALAETNTLAEAELLSRTNLPTDLAEYHLDFFVKIGLLEEQISEGRKVYRMLIEKERVQLIKELIEAWEYKLPNRKRDQL